MSEVRNALSRNGMTCKLDCMFQNWKVWATWTSLPPSLERLRIVEVDFRLFSCNCKQWRGIGGGGTIIRQLLRLMGGLFTYGSRFVGKAIGHKLFLESITVVCVCVPASLVKVSNDGHQCWPQDQGEAPYDHLAFWLGRLQDNGLLFGLVETLKLRCDGRDDKEWGVTDRGDTTKTAKEWAGYGWVPGMKLR